MVGETSPKQPRFPGSHFSFRCLFAPRACPAELEAPRPEEQKGKENQVLNSFVTGTRRRGGKSIRQERNPRTASGGDVACGLDVGAAGSSSGCVQMASQCCSCGQRWPGLNARPGRDQGPAEQGSRKPRGGTRHPVPPRTLENKPAKSLTVTEALKGQRGLPKVTQQL